MQFDSVLKIMTSQNYKMVDIWLISVQDSVTSTGPSDTPSENNIPSTSRESLTDVSDGALPQVRSGVEHYPEAPGAVQYEGQPQKMDESLESCVERPEGNININLFK